MEEETNKRTQSRTSTRGPVPKQMNGLDTRDLPMYLRPVCRYGQGPTSGGAYKKTDAVATYNPQYRIAVGQYYDSMIATTRQSKEGSMSDDFMSRRAAKGMIEPLKVGENGAGIRRLGDSSANTSRSPLSEGYVSQLHEMTDRNRYALANLQPNPNRAFYYAMVGILVAVIVASYLKH